MLVFFERPAGFCGRPSFILRQISEKNAAVYQFILNCAAADFVAGRSWEGWANTSLPQDDAVRCQVLLYFRSKKSDLVLPFGQVSKIF
jgi:hypothetical protein